MVTMRLKAVTSFPLLKRTRDPVKVRVLRFTLNFVYRTVLPMVFVGVAFYFNEWIITAFCVLMGLMLGLFINDWVIEDV